MATIDLIVLGMIKQEPMSAYEIQKLVDCRGISKWVKISVPSIYKKVLQLEGKGFIAGTPVKEGNKPEKSVYAITTAGERQFEKLMTEISCKPIHVFLDFNAVIVNLGSLPKEAQKTCLANIKSNAEALNSQFKENISLKTAVSEIPETGLAVLRQQQILAQAIEAWVESMEAEL